VGSGIIELIQLIAGFLPGILLDPQDKAIRSLKRWWTSTKLYGVTTQKTKLFKRRTVKLPFLFLTSDISVWQDQD
jgi:hypothetical protein